MSKRLQDPGEAFLRQAYLAEKKPSSVIARSLGVQKKNVLDWLRRHGIPTRGPSEAKLVTGAHPSEEFLRRRYVDEQVASTLIAKELGVTPHTVRRALRAYGIPIRDRSESHSTPQMRQHLAAISATRTGPLNGMYGKKNSPEAMDKQRKTKGTRFRGPNAPNWQGGITPLCRQIRVCTRYLRWRKMVAARDGNKCVLCGSTKKLNVDHIIPFAKILADADVRSLQEAEALPLLWDITNGRVLCETCHRQTPTYSGGYRKIYPPRPVSVR